MDDNSFCWGMWFGLIVILLFVGLLAWAINLQSENISCNNLALLTDQQVRPINGKDGCEIFVADKYWIPFNQWLKEIQ